MPFDALIIGGGPAGLAAGIVLAEAGVRTLLCERQPWPVDKPCGEGLMPTGWADLHALGVAELIQLKQQYAFTGIRYILPDGTAAEADFAPGPGRGLRRTVLSEALLRRARSLPALTLRENVKAQPVRRSAREVTVNIDGDAISTRLLIGADGLNSRVRTWAGLDAGRGKYPRYGARQHVRVKPWTDRVEVYWQQGVEAYVTPVGPEEVGVAFLWEKGRCAVQSGPGLLPSLLALFPQLKEKLGDASPTSPPMAVGPFHRKTRTVATDGVLLIGDAAGYLDAITGEGLSLAFAQARTLAETVVPVLRTSDGPVSRRALQGYVRAHRRITRSYYRMTHLALGMGRAPRLAERTIRALQREPRFFQHLLSANMGLRSPLAVAPSLLARFGWAFFYGNPDAADGHGEDPPKSTSFLR